MWNIFLFAAERGLLAFKFVFLVARSAEKVRNGTVGCKLIDLRISAVRAINPLANPVFGPCASAL